MTDEAPKHPAPHSGSAVLFLRDLGLGLVGMAVGGAAGYWVVDWLTDQGLYAISLIGLLMGLGCGALSGRRSIVLGVLCAIATAVFTIYVEWAFFPFVADGSLPFFLKNLSQVLRAHQILMVLGVGCGLWFGVGRTGGTWPRRQRAA